MRKGFLHVVEIVIVSLMTFLVILQFSYLPKQNIDWGGMKLSTQANDMLFSLDRKGVDWFNSTGVERAISSFVSNNTIFSLNVRNAMKPQIRVGCICSPAENTSLANALQPFEINGQPVGFSVTRIGSIAFSHDYDVIVINDSNMAGYYDQIRQFLAAGRGIVEFRHLDQSKMDSVQADFFGLNWNGLLPNPSADPVVFSTDASPEYSNIYKYFHNIPLYQENFSSITGWFTQIGSWNLNSQNYVGSSGSNPEAVSYYTRVFNDTYSVRALLKLDTANSRAKIILYRQDANNYVAVELNDNSDRVTAYNNVSGTATSLGFANFNPGTGSWHDVKAVPQPGNRLKIYINGSLVLTTTQPANIISNTRIALGVSGGQARFDNVRVAFAEGHNFSQILQNEKIQPQDFRDVILLQKGTQLPACVVNSNVADGNGRAAWLAYSDPGSSQDMANMLRTLVAWAAGEENEVVKNDVRNLPVVTSLYRTYDQDMYQPVEVVLTMGNLYG